ncbi:hypothetical protein DAEQUDRAFT_211815 [Daedalea quercina L-15889]|uniref:Uncharacterized protein n=1 Tax=Daedalea quercina L-15889 TaxID=1314783 RepID=A0A165RB67_9APHY|nr:hypothetical protein DAEQUDRAFT_211815 [Daedalea quercina L-15889]
MSMSTFTLHAVVPSELCMRSLRTQTMYRNNRPVTVGSRQVTKSRSVIYMQSAVNKEAFRYHSLSLDLPKRLIRQMRESYATKGSLNVLFSPSWVHASRQFCSPAIISFSGLYTHT